MKLTRSDIAVRDERILGGFRSGRSLRELASEFGLSRAEIAVVLRRLELMREAQLLADSICSRARALDDPDLPWTVADLVAALDLQGIIRTAVLRHFEWHHEPRLTLAQFDWVVSNTPHRYPEYAICPILDGRCVGTIGFSALVHAITARHLGPPANALWSGKLDILRRSSQIVGEQGACSKLLSFPIPSSRLYLRGYVKI